MARKSLVMTLVALFAITADAAQVIHVNASGDFANAFWVGSTPGISSETFVDAQRTGSSTFLNIFSTSFDSTTGNSTLLQGFGFVPGANLSVNPARLTATISTELANDPNFTLTSTVYDQFGNIISQTTISSGSINITLKKNGFFSSSFMGVQNTTFGNVILRQEANLSFVSASASGSFLGSAIPSDASGQIGTNHSNSITITKN
jgi:hypothetical protein